MKTKSSIILLWLTALTISAMADTIVMKDGTTREGTVVSENETSYIVEVQVTKSIKDEQVIPKADVDIIRKISPDVAAFEAIATLTPTPDALKSADYAPMIQKVEKFLNDHSIGLKAKRAKAILATLKSEAAVIQAGGIKLDGKMISAAEYKADAYDIDARIEATKIKGFIDSGNYLSALRSFSGFDRDFRNTMAYKETNPQIKKVMRTYVSGTTQSLATFDARMKERIAGLERMALADRSVTKKAIIDENIASVNRFKAEKTARISWVTTDPFFKPSLEQTVNFGKQEIARLDAMVIKPDQDGGRAYREAYAKTQAGDKAGAAAAINEAKTTGVSKRYLAILTAAAGTAGKTP